MELRYGCIDENVRRRSVDDIILHERQKPSDIADCRGETRWEGLLAVTRAVNRLAADRRSAQIFLPSVLLPPGTREETLRILYRQICCGAFAAGLKVAGGHVEVTDAVNRPVVTGGMDEISVLSSPKGLRGTGPDPEDLAPDPGGWDIIAVGQAGLEGTFLLVSLFREELQERFPLSVLVRMEELCRQLCVLPAARILSEDSGGGNNGRSRMVSLSAGGMFAGLWELSRKTGCGFCADLQAIPLLQETIEITEYFGIHPYMMRSEGCLLAAVPDGERAVQELCRAGLAASRIGALHNTRDKILCKGGEVRNLDRPQTDALDMYLYQRNYRYDEQRGEKGRYGYFKTENSDHH